jgi:hypothetical protein
MSWEAAQTEICQMCTPGMKPGWTCIKLGRPYGSMSTLEAFRVQCTVASKNRMIWISLSRTWIGALGMLPAGQGFKKDLFGGRVLLSIVNDRGLS